MTPQESVSYWCCVSLKKVIDKNMFHTGPDFINATFLNLNQIGKCRLLLWFNLSFPSFFTKTKFDHHTKSWPKTHYEGLFINCLQCSQNSGYATHTCPQACSRWWKRLVLSVYKVLASGISLIALPALSSSPLLLPSLSLCFGEVLCLLFHSSENLSAGAQSAV